MTADLDRAKYHKEMMTNYVAKIEKSSKDFWSNWNLQLPYWDFYTAFIILVTFQNNELIDHQRGKRAFYSLNYIEPYRSE